MEDRNLDLNLPLRREQWEEIGQRAAALDREKAEFEWSADHERIAVYLRNEEAGGVWRDLVSSGDRYGSPRVEIAEFVYNDGRPYAALKPPANAMPPAILPQQEAGMDVELERLVRGKWHRLLEESGLHFEFGHVSPDVD